MSYVRDYDLKQTTKYNLYNILSGVKIIKSGSRIKMLYANEKSLCSFVPSSTKKNSQFFTHTHTNRTNQTNYQFSLARKNAHSEKCITEKM